MGLDMYLYADVYVGGWDFNKGGNFDDLVNLIGITPTPASPSIMLSVTIAYWRKENAIHAWFVENVQNGVDECQKSYVPREALEALRDLCVKVNKDHSLAPTLLPTRPGFFFGGVEYDSWYFDGIRRTAKMLTEILDNPALVAVDFAYQASW